MKRALYITLLIAFVGVALGVPAFAQSLADPNYEAVLDTARQIAVSQSEAVRAKNDALPAALKACAEMRSEAVQVLCVLGVNGNLAGGGGMGAPGPVNLPVPPPPPKPPADLYSTIVNAPAIFFEAAKQIAPTIVQYLLGVKQTKSNEIIALAGSAERQALYGTFGSMHSTSVGGMRDVANQGFITIGAMPPGTVSTNTYNVSGSGVNFGSGALGFNPVTGSYNPRDCRGGAAAAGGGGGAGTTAGGAGAAGGDSPGGAC